MLRSYIRFGTIPQLLSSVSYGTFYINNANFKVVLGLNPGYIGAWLYNRQAVIGPSSGELFVVNSIQRIVVGPYMGSIGFNNAVQRVISINWIELSNYVSVTNIDPINETAIVTILQELPYNIDELQINIGTDSTISLTDLTVGDHTIYASNNGTLNYFVTIYAYKNGNKMDDNIISLQYYNGNIGFIKNIQPINQIRRHVIYTQVSTSIEDPYWNNVIYYAPMQDDFNDKSNYAVSSNAVSLYNANTYSCSIESGTGPYGSNCLLAPPGCAVIANVNAQLGTNDFTIEWWSKINQTVDNYQGFMAGEVAVNTPSATYAKLFVLNTVAKYFNSTGSATTYNIWNGVQLYTHDNIWKHCAIVRNGTSFSFYLNGQLYYNSTLTSGLSFYSGNPYWWFCKKPDTITSAVTTDRICNIRITKGVARYTSSFKPQRVPYYQG